MARLNYATRKRYLRCAELRRQFPDPGDTSAPQPNGIKGWRTEWDGEPFPVTVRNINEKETSDDHRSDD